MYVIPFRKHFMKCSVTLTNYPKKNLPNFQILLKIKRKNVVFVKKKLKRKYKKKVKQKKILELTRKLDFQDTHNEC